MKHSIKKFLLVSGGSVALALGIAGVFLPLLPTTPFLLLAAYCYLRSSPSLYRWLLGHRILGPYINNYLNHRAVTSTARTGALVFLWLTLTVSVVLVSRFALQLLLLAVGVGVSIHLFSLKTLSTGQTEELLPAETQREENDLG